MNTRNLLVALLACVGLLLADAPVRAKPAADQVAAAKTLFKAGARAYQVGRFGAAAKAFEQAYELVPRPELRFSAAQAHRRQYVLDKKLDHLRRARTHYQEYLKQVAQGGRRKDAVEGLEKVQAELRRRAPPPPDEEEEEEPEAETQPAEPAPAEPPPEEEKPTLQVDCVVAGATVSLDGGKPEPVPLIRDVTPGDHRIRVRAEGHEPVDRTVRVTARERYKSLEIELEELPAELTVRGEEGAEVIVDGRPVGATPLSTPVRLTAGKHRVAVGANGYEPWATSVDLKRGESRELEVELEMTDQRVGAWVSVGLGVAAAATGVVFVVLAAVNRREARSILDRRDDENRALTPDEAELHNAALDRRDDFSSVATAAFVGAGIGFGLGFVLYALDQPNLYAAVETEADAADEDEAEQPKSSSEISARVGPAPPGAVGAALRLRF